MRGNPHSSVVLELVHVVCPTTLASLETRLARRSSAFQKAAHCRQQQNFEFEGIDNKHDISSSRVGEVFNVNCKN